MRFLSVCAVVFLAYSLAPSVVRADAAADARKAIVAAYAKQSAAIPKGDFKSFEDTHTPDFYEVDKSGRKQELKRIVQAMSGIMSFVKNLKRSVSIQSVTVKGANATVAATEKVDAQIPNPQTNKTSNMHAERTISDTWISKNGKWLRKESKTLTEKQSMDGKPMGIGH
jgi:hypothetical protein